MASLRYTQRLFRFGNSWRSLSTSKEVAQEAVKAPVQVYGLEGRYAHAMFSAASKKKSLDKVETELNGFQVLLKESSVLSEFISNPTIRKQHKQAILGEVMKNQKYSELSINFFNTLADNNRLPKVSEVIKAFDTIMSAHRGEVTCVVTTAKALSDKNTKEIEGVLDGFLSKGQSLSVEYQTDSALIGGMVVDIGDKYIDMSTATKIKKIIQSVEQGL